VGRRRPTAGTTTMQAGEEAQQDTRRNQNVVMDAAATERLVQQPVLRRFEPYTVLAALARREEENG